MITRRGLRILIAGSGRLGYATMNPLLQSHHQIVGIVQNARKVPWWKRRILPWQHRFMSLYPSPLREAVKRGVPVCWLDTMDESELTTLRALKPDLLITCGFSIIVSEAILALPRMGCINVHTSLLPKHRGATPCAHVILDGDEESGVSIHTTEQGIDSGAILAQERFPVSANENSMDVYWASCALTESMILNVVDEIAEQGVTHATPQESSEGNYDPRFDENRARIHWNQSAETIERLIRAGFIYVPAYFEFRGERVHVREATTTTTEHDSYPGTILKLTPQLEVATASGTVILHNPYTQSIGPTAWPRWTTRLKVGMALD